MAPRRAGRRLAGAAALLLGCTLALAAASAPARDLSWENHGEGWCSGAAEPGPIIGRLRGILGRIRHAFPRRGELYIREVAWREPAPEEEPPEDAAAAVAGTWVLQQVGSREELARLTPEIIEPALAIPGVRGLSLRVPWSAIDEDFDLLEDGLQIVRDRDLAFSVRFMAGRHTPVRVFDQGARFYLVGQPPVIKVPAPFTEDGGPNEAFEAEYAATVERLAEWCRANGVRLLHLPWYGQDWAELNHSRQVRSLPGYSYEAWLAAHKRLLDIGLAHADEWLAVEFPFSGHGPLTEAAAELADYVVAQIGPASPRFFCQANGWNPEGEWGAPNADTEAAFARVWERPLFRGLQAIQPAAYDWHRMYERAHAVRATFVEVYAASFTLERREELAEAVARFAAHVEEAVPLPPGGE